MSLKRCLFAGTAASDLTPPDDDEGALIDYMTESLAEHSGFSDAAATRRACDKSFSGAGTRRGDKTNGRRFG